MSKMGEIWPYITTEAEIIIVETLDYHCTRCNAPTNDADLWREFCDRCQQLAELEREIGRNDLAIEMLTDMHYREPGDDIVISARDAAYTHRRQLITQWRKLHAEGAEAEAATERQEGE